MTDALGASLHHLGSRRESGRATASTHAHATMSSGCGLPSPDGYLLHAHLRVRHPDLYRRWTTHLGAAHHHGEQRDRRLLPQPRAPPGQRAGVHGVPHRHLAHARPLLDLPQEPLPERLSTRRCHAPSLQPATAPGERSIAVRLHCSALLSKPASCGSHDASPRKMLPGVQSRTATSRPPSACSFATSPPCSATTAASAARWPCADCTTPSTADATTCLVRRLRKKSVDTASAA